ncbi:peptidoglycan DD-metalloendopeptidase family protein [Streptomyces sp. Pv4-95]|uniref:M23 family metallopeptidase n=1 Tax=Streptomyces sp. Pv4-95 TaxID=3049543 RepID=UPI003891E892
MNDRHPSGAPLPTGPASDASHAHYPGYDVYAPQHSQDAVAEYGGGDPLFGSLPGSYETGQYDTGAYATDPYATGTYDTGVYDTGAYGQAGYGQGGYDATGHPDAFVPGQYDAGGHETGAYDIGSYAAYGTQQPAAEHDPYAHTAYGAPAYDTAAHGLAGQDTGAYGHPGYDTGYGVPAQSDGGWDAGNYATGGYDSGSYPTNGYDPAGYHADALQETGSFDATAVWSTEDQGLIASIPAQAGPPPNDTGQWDTTVWGEATGYGTGQFEATQFEAGQTGTGQYDSDPYATGQFETTSHEGALYGAAPDAAPGHDALGHDAFGQDPFGQDATPESAGHEFAGQAHETYESEDGAHTASTPVSEEAAAVADAMTQAMPVTPPVATRVVGREAGKSVRGRGRRRPVKRSALLTVAVPSVAAMGVCAVAAASVSGFTGDDKEEATAQAAPDTGGIKPALANSKLDTQLEGLSRGADDFRDRASRTQERIDLKERQALERKRAAEEAARKEAARPKFLLPVKQHGLSALYGQAGVNWMSVHSGIDFPVSYGTSVMAATDGTVRTQWNSAYGNMAIVTAPDGTETWYCHLSSTKIRSGSVKAGDQIAYSGNSGNSTGPHLHFEVRPGGGEAVDPLPWLRSHGLDPN